MEELMFYNINVILIKLYGFVALNCYKTEDCIEIRELISILLLFAKVTKTSLSNSPYIS
jgi:hypothetical protein